MYCHCRSPFVLLMVSSAPHFSTSLPVPRVSGAGFSKLPLWSIRIGWILPHNAKCPLSGESVLQVHFSFKPTSSPSRQEALLRVETGIRANRRALSTWDSGIPSGRIEPETGHKGLGLEGPHPLLLTSECPEPAMCPRRTSRFGGRSVSSTLRSSTQY